MNGGCDEAEVERLRHQIESALRRARGRNEVEPLLQRLLEIAPEGTDAAIFAHRHFAELLLEQHPWRAALHLRKVVVAHPDDDVVHALMGLCQALLGNFHASVSAYRRALRISPRNPWYHHNLGHLLDVAVGEPASAVSHLRHAHRMEPEEHEITASLAHCLARMGELREARELAEQALELAPRNQDHRALLTWIDNGAPDGGIAVGNDKNRPPSDPRAAAARKERTPSSGKRPASTDKPVLAALERGMREAGFSPAQRESARALWKDFRHGRAVRVVKPEVFAAAVEYAIALVQRLDGVTQASIARRYGVAPTSIAHRYVEIRDALELRPGDPRYNSLH